MSHPRPCAAQDRRLDPLLEALPDAALVLDRDRRIVASNNRFQEIFGNGQSPNGRHCYEVCHSRHLPCDSTAEICPLQTCLQTGERSHTLHVHSSHDGDLHTQISMQPLFDSRGEIDGLLEILKPVCIASTRPTDDRLVGRSPAFNQMLQDLGRLARTDKPVLIVGEAGTERESVARAIHDSGPRSHGPFVPLDCQALREWQFERELYGYEAGAFPGAEIPHPGLVGAASGGTLFLHEVENLGEVVQVKLRRLLDSGRYQPEGASHARPADFRLICSTRQDLKSLARDSSFREDLRLLIGSLPLRVPPLRERPEDLPLLARTQLRRLKCPQASGRISDAAMAVLLSYRFPGNTRELSHILDRASINAESGTIQPVHLPEECLLPDRSDDEPLEFGGPIRTLAEVEAHYLLWARRVASCSQRELADRLGISERTLYRRLREIAAAAREGSR